MSTLNRASNKLNWDAPEYIPPAPAWLRQSFAAFKVNKIEEFTPSESSSVVSEADIKASFQAAVESLEEFTPSQPVALPFNRSSEVTGIRFVSPTATVDLAKLQGDKF
jgi:hypothetical protein